MVEGDRGLSYPRASGFATPEACGIAGNQAALGGEGDPGALAGVFLRREFEVTRDAYDASLARGDIETRAVMAVRLLDLRSFHESASFAATPGELESMLAAWNDTFEATGARGSGGEIGNKLAGSFMEAARNLVEAGDARAQRRARELAGQRPWRSPTSLQQEAASPTTGHH